MPEVKLAALAIGRRTVALAHFRRNRLEDVVVRHIPVDGEKAASSVVGFLDQMSDISAIQYVALELPAPSASERHRRIYNLSLRMLRAKGIPCSEVPHVALLEAYGYPAVRRRDKLRRVGRAIWPSLSSPQASHAAVDAALLGLHVQVERMFQLHEEGA